MSNTPNQSAFAAANDLMARFDATIELFKSHIDQFKGNPKWSSYDITLTETTNDTNPFERDLNVQVAGTTQDAASPQPQNSLQRLRARTPHGKNLALQAIQTGGWAQVQFNINGDIKIKTGKADKTSPNMNDATIIYAGAYQSPDIVIAQTLLTIAHQDSTQGNIFMKMMINAMTTATQKNDHQ